MHSMSIKDVIYTADFTQIRAIFHQSMDISKKKMLVNILVNQFEVTWSY